MTQAPRIGRRRLAGVILCGGRSRRMGRDKALLDLDGERLVDRAAARLRLVSDPVMLACGDRPLTVPGCRTVADESPGAGPLAGIAAGLRASPHRLLAVVAVDMPWLDPDLLAQLASTWELGDDAVVPLGPGGGEPLHAVYAKSALPAVDAALAGGRLRARELLDDLRVRFVDVAASLEVERAARFAINVNTPEDLLRTTAQRGPA